LDDFLRIKGGVRSGEASAGQAGGGREDDDHEGGQKEIHCFL